MRKSLNPKSQIPKLKQITISKNQNSKPHSDLERFCHDRHVLVIEFLGFEIYLKFGACHLEFFIDW
ncbi:hypothetical protein D1AOALGA4SA_5043 [Olavius algarvensis Delta 1 endosymbiont]|nr:hypothetical protein D1AOALGA4SA_5043 [Olavius algarvensis Delta 1 endosymbiont]